MSANAPLAGSGWTFEPSDGDIFTRHGFRLQNNELWQDYPSEKASVQCQRETSQDPMPDRGKYCASEGAIERMSPITNSCFGGFSFSTWNQNLPTHFGTFFFFLKCQLISHFLQLTAPETWGIRIVTGLIRVYMSPFVVGVTWISVWDYEALFKNLCFNPFGFRGNLVHDHAPPLRDGDGEPRELRVSLTQTRGGRGISGE